MMLVPAHVRREVPAIPGHVAMVLNLCWSEAKIAACPTTRALFLTRDMLARVHAMQALARSSNRRRLQ